MHHAKRMGLGAVSTALVTLLCAPVASATTTQFVGPDHGREQIIRAVARLVQVENIDRGPSGPSLGDEIVSSGVLVRGDTQVGTYGQVCTVTRAGADEDTGDVQCVATVALPKGQITLQGLSLLPRTDPVITAITGGTGAYRTAHGYLRSVEISDTEAQVTFHIIP
ncbi:hypothetical protein BU52_17435 [Streptomyces toyocaensis]|uniref:Allene oxide cyclase barrel-like domain-containing protein n=1 Tax=Streptomyces toyocaensis TaxID=55952 RepID=A0A081XQS5_STRTO|nr:hypothetical protein [Streptomyces toyocaensis]KES05898.1 hypothetical protein BU52_17435 [Streptomyces toyocaensis]